MSMQLKTIDRDEREDTGTEPADAGADVSPLQSGPNRKRNRNLRRWLMLGGPAAVALVGAVIYFTSGHSVSTDNAYVKADKVIISPEVSGLITEVAVRENQHVAKGDVLFRIDDRPYRIALARADAALAAVRSDIRGLKASYRQKSAELVQAKTNEAFAKRNFDRQSSLASRQLTSKEALDQARHEYDTAQQQIAVLTQARAQILTQLLGNPDLPVELHPRYMEAKAARDQAALDLQHTVVRAPFAGVATKTPEDGQHVSDGQAVMSVVADSAFWVEANLKETELTDVRVGQPATIKVDTYPGVTWQGKVQSISQATGSEFSVLPAQNASGNWVKIVQRIPVRISVETDADHPPLRVGMSTEVTINTSSVFNDASGSDAR